MISTDPRSMRYHHTVSVNIAWRFAHDARAVQCAALVRQPAVSAMHYRAVALHDHVAVFPDLLELMLGQTDQVHYIG
jgi:hypothetical protein